MSDDVVEAQRHAETIEHLRRICVALEALHFQGERQLRMSAEAAAKFESALDYAIKAWQAVAPKREPRP